MISVFDDVGYLHWQDEHRVAEIELPVNWIG